MSDLALRIENLGKRYRLGPTARYRTFRESLTRALSSPFRPGDEAGGPSRDATDFWALRGISFDVKRGEVLGIIGPNGAGKSTLLKILSRITEPTEGQARIFGRIGSLLEVGTGFHSELTGRENIYLNGAILGMKQREIDRRFDEIVAFSELERFLDTPVKHYSSGMYMRLAFAVAAHLEPEILVIDEVLAVGDAAFQKKCLGKMDDVARSGRTVLFVSHDMRVIRALCQSALCFQGGKLVAQGPVQDVILYYNRTQTSLQHPLPARTEDMVVHAFDVAQAGHPTSNVDGAAPFTVSVDFEVLRDLTLFRIGIYLRTAAGETIVRSLIADWDDSRETIARGRYRATLEVPPDLLAQGAYRLSLHASRYGIVDYLHRFALEHPIQVMGSRQFNAAHMGERVDFSLILRSPWTVRPSPEPRTLPEVLSPRGPERPDPDSTGGREGDA